MTTLITNGTGKGIVIQTGSNTLIGRIALLALDAKQEKTTLQKEITNFVTLIAVFAICTVIICFLCWGVWINKNYPTFLKFSDMLVNAIAILVAFIPTGLPVAVTLSLLLVARKMSKSRVLVKNLTVIETLSCCNVIASDKTGTLTQNQMSVANACVGLTPLNIASNQRAFLECPESKSIFQLLNACVICNESKFCKEDEAKHLNERKGACGGATDIAILKYCAGIIDLKEVEKMYELLDVCAFNSKTRWMARIFKVTQTDRNDDCFTLNNNECLIIIKGKIVS